MSSWRFLLDLTERIVVPEGPSGHDLIAHPTENGTSNHTGQQIVRKAHRDGAYVVESPQLCGRQDNRKAPQVVFPLMQFPCSDNRNHRDRAVTKPCEGHLSGRNTQLFAHGDDLAHGAKTWLVRFEEAGFVHRRKALHHF
jgi:hypothetical protein